MSGKLLYGWGIKSNYGAAGSNIALTNCTFRYLGSYGSGADEYNGFVLQFKSYNSVNTITIDGSTFDTCSKPLNYIDCSGTSIILSNVSFLDVNREAITFGDGLIYLNNCKNGQLLNASVDAYIALFTTTSRPDSSGWTVSGLTGNMLNQSLLPNSDRGVFENNSYFGFSGTFDSGGFSGSASSEANRTYWRNNTVVGGNRVGRVGSYQTLSGNKISRTYHHGIVWHTSNSYITGTVIQNNIISDCKTDMGGGIVLGYNYTQWLDDITINNNTFDNGIRGFYYNDQESTVVLATRVKFYNNIISNSYHGIQRPANGATTNVTRFAPTLVDYNLVYNAVNNNQNQASFKIGTDNYHTTTRNVMGVYLHNPVGYTLPTADNSLVQANTGTIGTDLSIVLAFNGGTSINIISDQGPASSGSTTTLVKTGAGWTVNAHIGSVVYVVSGAGSGEYYLVKSNTSDTLTFGYSGTAINSTSVFILVNTEAVLIDGTATVQCGINPRELITASGTYTDTGISITSNALAVDPQYNATFAPQNMALATAGEGGTYIGAVQPVASGDPQTITFGALPAVTYGGASFALTATASSGLPVSYASSNTAVATVSGSTVTIVGVGSTNITATQAGDGTWAAATPVVQALTVNASYRSRALTTYHLGGISRGRISSY